MSGAGYLLDTQIVLWDLADDPRISKTHDAILLGDAPKFFSIASHGKSQSRAAPENS